ncbi:MAG: DUF4255 domain-containing protein [Chloroflexi bacterium]|nr:DUF4255 domain-containing protein [Chloroflexota bacterium]
MINDLDEVLRQVLIRELPIKNGEVDIAFDQPKREWSARLNRPTLNLFLHDVRENNKLRQTQPAWEVERQGNGKITQRRKPVRVDLHYMITAWTADPEDEHRLLTRTLLALFRLPHLPEELLPENLQGQPVPIPIIVAQSDELRTPADIWSALDNELRPAIVCTITLALNPYQPLTTPLVSTRELRVGQAAEPLQQRISDPAGPEIFWTIGGTVRSDESQENLRLTLVEKGLEVPIQAEGRFAIGNLKAGDYTLEVQAEGRQPHRHPITVPAPDYELKV